MLYEKVYFAYTLRLYSIISIESEAAVTRFSESIPADNTAVVKSESQYKSLRPSVDQRTFVSPAVERRLTEIVNQISDPKLAWLFSNCFPNTLDTTVRFTTKDGQPDTFVITGDIDAMWLRDSSAQVWSYMDLLSKDPMLQQMVKGLIRRQLE